MEITLMCSEHSAHSVDSGLEESGHSNLEVSLGNGVEVGNEVDIPVCSKDQAAPTLSVNLIQF